MENESWDDLRVLLAVSRCGSLLAAGRSLGISTSTVGRRMDALEAVIGTKLVHRTQTGAKLMERATPLVALAEELEHGLTSQRRDQRTVAGTVRISVPEGLVPVVAKAIVSFHKSHPSMDVELIGESRIADVAKREADIAVRLVRSTSHFLVERKIATIHFSLFGSEDYIERNLTDRALRSHSAALQTFIGLDTRWSKLPQEQWLSRLGATRFAFRGAFDAVMTMTREGIGLAALPDHIGYDAGLVRISTDTPAPVQPLYLVYHRDLRQIPHIHAILACIKASMLPGAGSSLEGV